MAFYRQLILRGWRRSNRYGYGKTHWRSKKIIYYDFDECETIDDQVKTIETYEPTLTSCFSRYIRSRQCSLYLGYQLPHSYSPPATRTTVRRIGKVCQSWDLICYHRVLPQRTYLLYLFSVIERFIHTHPLYLPPCGGLSMEVWRVSQRAFAIDWWIRHVLLLQCSRGHEAKLCD